MTNWEYLLGTPALAAQFLMKVANSCCGGKPCDECKIPTDICMDYKAVKEWLESEMD